LGGIENIEIQKDIGMHLTLRQTENIEKQKDRSTQIENKYKIIM
jgi:hypothetical protein